MDEMNIRTPHLTKLPFQFYDIKNWKIFQKTGGSKISQIHLRKTHIVEKTTKFVQNKKKN